MHAAPQQMTPLILIVSGQESHSRSLEATLRPKGHVVLKVSSGQRALNLTEKVNADVILLARHLSDADGIDLIRRLRTSPTVSRTTPILLTADHPLGKAERLEALGAGAWDVLDQPIDPAELILRLDTFVTAKREIDRVQNEGLTDPGTGFYNVRGVLKRARELSADATRSRRPLTCIALGTRKRDTPTPRDTKLLEEDMRNSVSRALRDTTRVSDAIGRLTESEFVVVAPGTDEGGAVRLADRILDALAHPEEDLNADERASRVARAGVCSVRGSDDASAEDLLLRATMALRRAQQEDGTFRVRSFDA